MQIHIPPLHERPEDIPILAQAFLKRYSEETGKELLDFESEVMDLFFQYPWPGNVRELQHTVEHSAVFATGPFVTLKELPE